MMTDQDRETAHAEVARVRAELNAAAVAAAVATYHASEAAMRAHSAAVRAAAAALPLTVDYKLGTVVLDSDGLPFVVARVAFQFYGDHNPRHKGAAWGLGGPAVRADGTRGTRQRYVTVKLDGSDIRFHPTLLVAA